MFHFAIGSRWAAAAMEERLDLLSTLPPHGGIKLWVLLIGMGAINTQLAPCVEPVLAERAKVDRKPLSFLETRQDFIASADRIEDSRYIWLQELSLDALSENSQRTRDMYAAWIGENLHDLDFLLTHWNFYSRSSEPW